MELLSDREIKSLARSRLAGRSLARILLTQALTEAKVVLRTGLDFRTRENQQATQAYALMGSDDFEGLNARQQWANWRTIPRNLATCGFGGPIRAIDLCCGVGHSTEVLACFLPRGSSILGLEFNPEFVRRAGSRRYFHRDGDSVYPSFRAQSVLEPFHDASGALIPDESIDLVCSSGAVGCHFDSAATARLAAEVARVLKAGGFAMIDAGKAGTSRRELRRIFTALAFRELGFNRSCIWDRYEQVRFVKQRAQYIQRVIGRPLQCSPAFKDEKTRR